MTDPERTVYVLRLLNTGHIVAVYATREAAQQRVDEQAEHVRSQFTIQTYEVLT